MRVLRQNQRRTVTQIDRKTVAIVLLHVLIVSYYMGQTYLPALAVIYGCMNIRNVLRHLYKYGFWYAISFFPLLHLIAMMIRPY